MKVVRDGLSGERPANFSTQDVTTGESLWVRLELDAYADPYAEGPIGRHGCLAWCLVYVPEAKKAAAKALKAPEVPALRGPTPDRSKPLETNGNHPPNCCEGFTGAGSF